MNQYYSHFLAFLLTTVDKVTFAVTWQFPFVSDLCLNVNQSVNVSCSFKAAVYDAVSREAFSTRTAPLENLSSWILHTLRLN